MSRQIQTITEKNRFDSIINKYFSNNSLFYKSQSGNIEVQYLGNNNGMAEIKFPNSIGVPDECVFFTSNDKTVIISYMAKKSQKSEEIALYNPSSFQIVSSSRNEIRKNIEIDKKSLLYARNMISEHQVKNNLKRNLEKVNRIKELILQNEPGPQSEINIKFLDEIDYDTRLNFLKKFKRTLFIPSRFKDNNNNKINPDLTYYLNNIYSSDNDLNAKSKLVSEICVPIIYKNKIIIGYVQLNSQSFLSLSSLHNYNRLALAIENKIVENKIIEENEEEFLISNISSNGVCIVFKQNGNLQKFMDRGLAYFDIMLPFRQKVTLITEVRHIIDLPNSVKKIGFKILETDKMGKEFLKRYLDSLAL